MLHSCMTWETDLTLVEQEERNEKHVIKQKNSGVGGRGSQKEKLSGLESLACLLFASGKAYIHKNKNIGIIVIGYELSTFWQGLTLKRSSLFKVWIFRDRNLLWTFSVQIINSHSNQGRLCQALNLGDGRLCLSCRAEALRSLTWLFMSTAHIHSGLH